MKRVRHKIIIVSVIIGLFVSVGCFILFIRFVQIVGENYSSLGPTIPSPDRNTLPQLGLFDNHFPDCLAECWRNLRIDESTIIEIETFFDTNFEEYHLSHSDVNQINHIEAKMDDSESGVIATRLQNNTLINIQLIGPFNMDLSEVIDELGKPDYSILSVEKDTIFTSVYEVVLQLFYPDLGYVFNFINMSGININEVSTDLVEVCIHDEILVWKVDIVRSGDIEDILVQLRPQLSKGTQDLWNTILEDVNPNFTIGCIQVGNIQ